MPPGKKPAPSRLFLLEIILPSLFAANLIAGVLFFHVLPSMENALMDGKRELIRELTATAVSILAEEDGLARKGALTLDQAKARAIQQLRLLRYGNENKDYFWVIDLGATMVMHPYRPDLEGSDVKQYRDSAGNAPFADMAAQAVRQGEGYADYIWQWKDEAGREAPKLSYVRLFQPWGWIVGTGVYVTDVQSEIGSITRNLVFIFVGVTAAIVAALALITRRGLALDRQRAAYAEGLRLSRERYKALLESSADGVMLLFDGRVAYANAAVINLLGYSLEELARMDLEVLFAEERDDLYLGFAYFKDFVDGLDAPGQFQAMLRAKDGRLIDAALICSRMTLAGRTNVSVIVRDVRQHKELAERFDQSARRLEFLSRAAGFGVFRASATSKGRFLEANAQAASYLGFENPDALLDISLGSVFDHPMRAPFLARLLEHGVIHRELMEVRGEDGRLRTLAVSATVVKDERGYPQTVEGLVEDATSKARSEKEQERVIAELQASLQFMSGPASGLAWTVELSAPDISIREASGKMSGQGGVVLVSDGGAGVAGIVTEHDLRERVVRAGLDPSGPVSAIMSSPVVSLGEGATISEAVLACERHGFRHVLLPSPEKGRVQVVDAASLARGQKDSLGMLLWRMSNARDAGEAVKVQSRLPVITCALVENGAGPDMVTHLFSTASDAFTRELLRRAEEELGPPPCGYDFLLLGSQGRLEQTLKTDQDNAIIHEDVPERDKAEVSAYFLRFGERMCGWLDAAGYQFCQGGIMARNPEWNMPLSGWKERFSRWVREAGPEELLQVKIFFDFRALTGGALARELREHLWGIMGPGSAAFFNHLAKNCLLARPPLDFFRNIALESEGGFKDSFNIKKAMTPIVDMARIYALKENLEEANTRRRLRLACERGAFNVQDSGEALAAFDALMRLRLENQCRGLASRGEAANFVSPRSLTRLELEICREAFLQIAALQKKLSFDFTGMV